MIVDIEQEIGIGLEDKTDRELLSNRVYVNKLVMRSMFSVVERNVKDWRLDISA